MKLDMLTMEVIEIGLKCAINGTEKDQLVRLADGLLFFTSSICKFDPPADKKRLYDRAWEVIEYINRYQQYKTS